MKVIFILFTMLSFCFPQVSGLALYGLGERIGDADVASVGLGDGTFFSGNKYEISLSSPSSLWKSSLTRFSIHSGINYLRLPSYSKQFQHNLTHFSISFPIGKQKVFGFGLKPYYRTNTMEINEDDFQYVGANDGTTSFPIAYQKNYYLDGGISGLFFQYSMKINTNLSFGFQYSFLFGNQTIDETRYAYDIQIDSTSTLSDETIIEEFIHENDSYYIYAESEEITIIQNSNKFSSSKLIFEGRYALDKHEYALRVAINGNMKIKSTLMEGADINDDGSIDVQNTFNTIYYYNYESTNSKMISDIAFGYQNKISKRLGVIIETQINYPINISEKVALFGIEDPYENSIHFGIYNKFINPKHSFWNNLNLRAGIYKKELEFSENRYKDYGFTLGFGFEYLANTQSFDLALRAGKKESVVLKNQFEDYISFHLSIITGEKWFMKRRRK